MTYIEAYNKIIEAYFKDEIQPLDPIFCFCGTLCNNTSEWFLSACEKHNASHGYKGREFVRMEKALLFTMDDPSNSELDYEDQIFKGMCAALDVLKEIHRERGEDVDQLPALTKRQISIG